jgi:hypothetical protein
MPVSVPAFSGLNGTIPAQDASREDVSAVVQVGAALGAATADGDDSEPDDNADLVRIITARHDPHLLWVHEHLQHLSSHAQTITAPATHVAEQRRLPWWR